MENILKGVSVKEFIEQKGLTEIRLHLGCGGIKLENYINIDLYPFDPAIPDCSRSGCVADVFCDIRKIDLDSQSVDEIYHTHVIEHFCKWDALDAFARWHKILKKGAPLIIETPDFIRCIIMLLNYKKKNRLKARSQFYGNQVDRLDYETHRYVWSAGEIKRALLDTGFSKVHITHKTKTHKPGRDMRVVAIK